MSFLWVICPLVWGARGGMRRVNICLGCVFTLFTRFVLWAQGALPHSSSPLHLSTPLLSPLSLLSSPPLSPPPQLSSPLPQSSPLLLSPLHLSPPLLPSPLLHHQLEFSSFALSVPRQWTRPFAQSPKMPRFIRSRYYPKVESSCHMDFASDSNLNARH